MMQTIHAHPTLYEAMGEAFQRRLRAGHQCVSAPVRELGRMDYGPRSIAAAPGRRAQAGRRPDQLLLLEHPHVITLGRNGHAENLLASDEIWSAPASAFHPTDRGGDVTYHGPGQIVGYPILDLREWKRDVGAYVRAIEQT
jgi:lipoyl(octanoyl) transferase